MSSRKDLQRDMGEGALAYVKSIEIMFKAKMRERPPKLQVCKGKGKRAASPHPAPPTATAPISAGTIRGSSAATTKKLASFMTFVPTPGFKRPRKKDDGI
ncbi:uncharacterized protein LOC107459602 isoform X2 [Arachis duranensis]|uniref:Uncharacterized protein LOC107459602 isoform X2 n=1 Tax=Arachis duranensis TaxID=130453 RepID=A0A9C6WN31_ARADU|nr:uncharacterized protein LOC107459602 isoform X2 [Arachis duranensis]